ALFFRFYFLFTLITPDKSGTKSVHSGWCEHAAPHRGARSARRSRTGGGLSKVDGAGGVHGAVPWKRTNMIAGPVEVGGLITRSKAVRLRPPLLDRWWFRRGFAKRIGTS